MSFLRITSIWRLGAIAIGTGAMLMALVRYSERVQPGAEAEVHTEELREPRSLTRDAARRAPSGEQGSNVAHVEAPIEGMPHEDRGSDNSPVHYDHSTLSQYAHEYSYARFNVRSNASTVLDRVRAGGGAGIEALRFALSKTDSLHSLPKDVQYATERPPIVVERMAMIDMLERLSEEDSRAMDALVDIVLDPLPPDAPKHTVQVIVGEKYDALCALARRDWTVAADTFAEVASDSMKDVLRPAMVRGRMDAGETAEQATRRVEAL